MAVQKRLWERGWTKGTTAQALVEKDKKARTPRVYTLQVFLTDGPVTKAFASKEISRTIQIRGDQTLQALHRAIFKAFDREEEHLHEFNFGKGPYDRNGPRYTLASNPAISPRPKAVGGTVEQEHSGGRDVAPIEAGVQVPRAVPVGLHTKDFMTDEVTAGDVAKTTLESLGLEVGRAFGYWFDFGDDWRHEIRVEAIESAPPKGRFPKVIVRVGESPPQYADPEELE